MSTEISPENEAFIREAVAAGRYETRRQALDEGIRKLREEVDTIDAIRQGLASIDTGEGMPLAEADEMLREKHNIPRSA
jgi:Arc/MetJ-type ribon-helix-helix transcriptional regulator